MKILTSAPRPSELTKATIHDLAEKIAKQVGYEPNGDLNSALKKLGGRLTLQDFSGLQDSDSGSLLVLGDADFEVKIAYNTSQTRDRFTIAHEIGHYVLHYLYPKKKKGVPIERMEATRYGSDRAEWEANWFAAAFLMPREEFSRAFRQFEGDISRIASKFGVSASAAQVRAKSLGLI